MATKMTKVSVDISRETDAEVLRKSNNAFAGSSANLLFPNLPVPSVQWKADISNYSDKLTKALHGSETDTLNKNLAREVLVSDYRVNGTYVNSICNGDKAKAETSGYEFYHEKAKDNPPDLEARNMSLSGAIKVISRAKPVGLIARLIQYSYTPSDANSWQWGGVTRKQIKNIVNLNVGQRVWIRVAVVNLESFVEWSEPFSIFVT